MDNPASRDVSISTAQFLTFVGRSEYGQVHAGEDPFFSMDLDECELDPELRAEVPSADVEQWADSEPDDGDVGEPGGHAASHAAMSSTGLPLASEHDDVNVNHAHGDSAIAADFAHGEFNGDNESDEDDESNGDHEYGGDDGPVETDDHPSGGSTPTVEEPPAGEAEIRRAAPRFSKPVAASFLSVVGVVTIGVATAMVGMQSHSEDAVPPVASPSTVSVVPAPPPPQTAASITDPAQDVPIPYQASSPCPQAGSGSAQNVASGDPTRAWVCMRDADGQVITLDLGKPMKVTAIELTPGWVGTDTSGNDQWMAHRVVTRVQWILINGADRTVVTQNTGNAHGPVTQAMPSNGPDQGVLASQIQMVVRQTSRPPADNITPGGPGGAPTGEGGLLTGILGAPIGGGQTNTTPSQDPNFGVAETGSDPVDHTVAISSIKVFGHAPL